MPAMAEPALLPAAPMEGLALMPLAAPCPRIPRARIARRCAQHWVDLGCSSSPGPAGRQQPPQRAESLPMDSFWKEVERIRQRHEPGEESPAGSGGEARLLEEGEAESQWLRDTGLSGLLSGQSMEGDHQELLSTLTQTQVAAVWRRLNIYARSARRRHKAPVRDVRDIFRAFDSGQGPPESATSCLKGPRVISQPPTSPPATAEPGDPHAQGPAWSQEAFCMDLAYSEQAARLLHRGRWAPTGLCAWGRGSLPEFRVPKGRLGLTRIEDLCSQDMQKVPALALIELTALCDVLSLDLKRNKATKRKTTETGLFGVPLDNLLQADRRALPSTQVPLLLQALLSCLEERGLDVEGILRVPGSQARVKGLEQRLEREFYSGLFCWDQVHLNDMSDLLKRFIRELPAPLLTAEYLPAFAVVSNIPHLKQRLQALHLLILILPEPNRNALKALLEFLRKVVAHEKSNKMSLWNVSTVMAPSLFLHQGRTPKLPKGNEKQLAEGAAEVVQMMIHYQDLLWTVASFLVAQVRKLNDSSGRRPQLCDGGLKTWLRRLHADRDQTGNDLDPEAIPKVAKVRVAWPSNDFLTVPLTPSIRVAHVLKQFTEEPPRKPRGPKRSEDAVRPLPRCPPSKPGCALLYEVGGNIGERRLDPDAFLLDLYRTNPHGQWVIRQGPT